MQLIQPSLRDVHRAEASKRFGRYKPEDHATVRPAQLRGDELGHLRQKRELLRSMSPEQAMQVIEFHQGLNVFEALALAKKERKILVPNYVLDRILTETDDAVFFGNYPVWTGTAVVYEAPGRRLGKGPFSAGKTKMIPNTPCHSSSQ
ncbi:MAG: hypothetical protein AB1529_00490 [Candidatus Micrarchaeota archaeon]